MVGNDFNGIHLTPVEDRRPDLSVHDVILGEKLVLNHLFILLCFLKSQISKFINLPNPQNPQQEEKDIKRQANSFQTGHAGIIADSFRFIHRICVYMALYR